VSSGCLPGVTRELLLEAVRVVGIPMCEKPLGLEDLERADEVFITSTTRNLLPVASIEGRAVSHRGDVRHRLGAAFESYVDAYLNRCR
jgi:branched-subunit amino acid aminotransferase/4-amino-4-deoxychorismate lyase